MALAQTVAEHAMKVVTGAKTFKGAKSYTSKKGSEGLILSEMGGFVPEDVGEVQKDGKTYIIAVKFSVTAREKKDGVQVKAGSSIL